MRQPNPASGRAVVCMIHEKPRAECTTKCLRATQTSQIAPEGRDRRIPKTRPSEPLRSRVTAEGRSID
eukprot:5391974-Pyramimonas_sp.AAC.1